MRFTILAKKLGTFSLKELRNFYYACLLHDIGKIQVPDRTLTKPSRLTNKEHEIIKLHPVVGVQAIQEIESLADSTDLIKYHHERWDGKAYPEGLSGEAYERIIEGAGIQFDPKLVGYFKKVFPEWVELVNSEKSGSHAGKRATGL